MRMKKREKKREWVTLLMFVSFVLGASAQSLSKKFSASFKNTPLPTALKKIGKQSGVRVEFAYEDVKGYSVSAHLTAVNAENAVKAVIANRPLSYKVVGDKFIIITKGTSHQKTTPNNKKPEVAQKYEEVVNSKTQQMDKTVTGKVVDENNQPLPGVSVKCGNNRMGTYTNADGEFVFTLPENHVSYLTFSYIGMQEQKVKLSAKNSNHMQIVMHEDAGALDEVVVTGYQVLDKRSLTSAVTSVKMDELKRADMSSLDQMLEGKIADLMVTNNSAEVGVAPKIRIRGTSTLIGNREPLWVVDGIVVSDPVEIAPEELNDPDYVNRIGNAISGINPQDIERIDVLKDAAATAIYGTKAANGVIVVTTKRGFEGKPQVSYSTNVTYKRRPRYSDHSVDVMTSKERIQFSRELEAIGYTYNTYATRVGYEKALDDLYNKNIDYKEFVNQVSAMEGYNTDWFDLICRDSWSQQHSASLSGGSQKSRYYASLGYNKDNDVIKVNSNERYTAAVNLDNTFSKLLTASFNVSAYHYNRNYYQEDLAPLNYAYGASRAINPFNADGTYAYYQRKVSSYQEYNYNILNELDNSYKKQETNSFTATANLKFNFTDWLNANAIFSMTQSNTDQEGYWGEKTTHVAYLRTSNYGERVTDFESCTLPQGGELTKTTVRNQSYTARLQLNANKYFGEDDKHNIDATFGLEINSDKYKSHSSVARGYYPDRGETFVTGIDLTKYTGYATWLSNNVPTIVDDISNKFSTYLSVTYAYKRLWRINLNGRIDGSNKFGDRSNDKFLPIWSLSGSYDLGSFIKAKWVDYITAKASYGFQGNMLDTESPVMTIKKGAMDSYYNEFTSSVYAHPNPDLKWEKTNSYNIGLDMSLFDHRLEMEISAYYKKTKDAFMNKKVSSVNGVTSYVINGGDVTNKGYSFDITYNAIRNKDFRWSLSTSISKVINSIDSRPDAQTYDLEAFLNGSALVQGKSVNTFYSYRFLGLSPVDGGPLFDDYFDNQAALRGLSKYDVYTTVLEASGKRDADIQGSLTNTFRYKNWRASLSLGYSLGAKTRLFAMYGSAASGGVYGSSIYSEKNYSRDYLKRWQKPGDEKNTNIPAIIPYGTDAYWKYNNFWSNNKTTYNDIPTIANDYWDMYDYSNIRVVSADYLKLQSMSVTYEMPTKALNVIGLQRLAVTASAYNLFTICDSALKGQTPTQGGFSSIQLSDRPSFSLGLNVIF